MRIRPFVSSWAWRPRQGPSPGTPDGGSAAPRKSAGRDGDRGAERSAMDGGLRGGLPARLPRELPPDDLHRLVRGLVVRGDDLRDLAVVLHPDLLHVLEDVDPPLHFLLHATLGPVRRGP